MKNPVIRVKYEGPTDTRGARMIATCQGRQKSVPYDYSVNSSQRSENAARALQVKLGLSGKLVEVTDDCTGGLFEVVSD